MPDPDSVESVWQLVEFSVTEAMVLRSFLEYLRTSSDSAQEKLERLANWKREAGIAMGDPRALETARDLFRGLRAAAPEARTILLRATLDSAYSNYFQP